MRVFISCGLVILFCLLGNRAMAFGNCLDAGYLAGFREGLAPQACDDEYYVTVPAATGNALLRVIRLSASPRGPGEDWRRQVEALASGVGAAMDAIGTARLPAEITVLLTDATDSSPTLAEVHADASRIPGGECQVTFYKLAAGASPEEFAFTLAHEIFHCVQYETWPDTAGLTEAGWWAEGSAEYFANLAQPGTGYSDGWLSSFDNRSIAEPLTAMEYETVVFFSWLSQRGGPAAVAAFLGQMRAGDQIQHLRDLVPLADWTSFVEAWLDGEVALPGGDAIRPAPVFSAEGRFDSPITLEMSARPYVIERWDMTFVEQKLFDLEYSVTDSAMQAAMRKLGSGAAWAAPPPAIDTCKDEERHILYHTATDGPASATLEITTDADTTGGACCLVGTWKPTPETLAGLAAFGMDIGAPAIAAAGGSMSCEYDGGDWLLGFSPDQTGSIAFDAHSTRCTVRAQGGAMASIGTRSGHTDFDWTVRGDGAAATRYTGHEVAWTNTIKIGPVSQTMTGNDEGPSRLPSGFAFTCDKTSLTVKGIYGLSTYEAAHTRVPEASP
jgi:hypothetical protein